MCLILTTVHVHYFSMYKYPQEKIPIIKQYVILIGSFAAFQFIQLNSLFLL